MHHASYLNMRNVYSSQIVRIDGKNVFVEILNSAFPIGKLQMNFIEYDEKTNKQLKKLDLYIDALLAVSLAEKILNGSFAAMVAEMKASGNTTQWTSFFTDMGGISEDKVAAKFKEYSEKYPFLQQGQAISRQLKIQTGNKYAWVLRAEYGPGKSSDKGLIVPAGSPPMVVNVPMDDDSLRRIAVAIKYSYQAYLNQYYSKYSDKLFPNDKVNVFNPN